MNATIIRSAQPNTTSQHFKSPARPCVIQIDGVEWVSPVPDNAGEAESFNQDARKIAEMLWKK